MRRSSNYLIHVASQINTYFQLSLNSTSSLSILQIFPSFPKIRLIISCSMKLYCFRRSLLKFYSLAECHETYLSWTLDTSMIFLKLESVPSEDILQRRQSCISALSLIDNSFKHRTLYRFEKRLIPALIMSCIP